MADLVDRQRVLDSIDPERILPDWVRGYVVQQIKEVPVAECPKEKGGYTRRGRGRSVKPSPQGGVGSTPTPPTDVVQTQEKLPE